MNRMSRINQQMKREIGLIIHQELGDPRLQFVAITRAEVTADLRHARVYFRALGDAAQIEAARMGLEKAGKLIRRMVSQTMNLRFTPELIFFYDDSLDKLNELSLSPETSDEVSENEL